MSRGTGADNSAFSPDFLDFIECLNKRRVHFVLVGGYALGVHGLIRATADIDFLFRGTRANVKRLCGAMKDFGAPPQVIDERALMTANVVTQLGQPPQRIDLLNAIDGVSFHEVWAGAMKTTIGNQSIRVIGFEEMLKNKTATGRTKDAEDARMLRRRSER